MTDYETFRYLSSPFDTKNKKDRSKSDELTTHKHTHVAELG